MHSRCGSKPVVAHYCDRTVSRHGKFQSTEKHGDGFEPATSTHNGAVLLPLSYPRDRDSNSEVTH